MKSFLIVILGLVVSTLLPAQYYVIKTVGKVYADGVLLQRTNKIAEQAQLRFSDQTAYAHVLSPARGHFILTGRSASRNVRGEFFTALKDALIPPHEFQAAATRSEDQLPITQFEDQYELKAFFQEQLILLDTLYFTLDSRHYPLDERHYFELRSEQDRRRRPLVHRLVSYGSQIAITPQVTLDRRDRDISERITQSNLVYVDATAGTEQLFGPFTLVFLAEEEVEALRQELQMLHEVIPTLSRQDFIISQVLPYLHLHFGRVTARDVDKLLLGWYPQPATVN